MDYIIIKNKGLIVKEDLFLIGSSTKRNDNTKIGMFGSGWKYALAWFLRNNCHVIIYSGKEQINISTISTMHRDMPIQVIAIDGKPTSLTTEMGMKWTGWMAIREVIANAIDEGGFELQIDGTAQPIEDTTTIYIGVNEELKTVVDNYNDYFSFDRQGGILFENAYEDEDIIIYPKSQSSKLKVYRKGISCYNSSIMTFFDIDIKGADINESRLTDSWNIDRAIKTLLISNNITFYIIELILKSNYDTDWLPSLTDTIQNLLAKEVENGRKFVSNIFSRLFGAAVPEGSIIIPNSWHRYLVSVGLIEDDVVSLFGLDVPKDFLVVEVTNRDKVLQIINTIIPDFKIVYGEFENTYENFRVVGKVGYVKHTISYSDTYLAACLLSRVGITIWEDVLGSKVEV